MTETVKKKKTLKKKEPEQILQFGRDKDTPDISFLPEKNTNGFKVLYDKYIEEISGCTKCPLFELRCNAVAGRGNINADIVFMGEAPGEKEDIEGKAFVGKSGKHLDRIIKVLNLDPDNIYFLNTLHCRPPNNKFPEKEIAGICVENYLWRHLDMIRPKAICVFGGNAARMFMGFPDSAKVTEIVGQSYEPPPRIAKYCEEVFVTYHPAYILRKPKLAPTLAEHLTCFKTDLKLMGLIPTE